MSRRILIIEAHPDRSGKHLCRAFADAYAQGAEAAGHMVRRIDIAMLDFALLRSKQEFEDGEVPEGLKASAHAIEWSEHLVFLFPLWLGTMPALLKAFLEQVMRPGTAFDYVDRKDGGRTTKARLDGRSARIVVTMGMPAIVYRFWFFGHGINALHRNILNFVGIRPVRQTLFGGVEMVSDAQRSKWIENVRSLGRKAM